MPQETYGQYHNGHLHEEPIRLSDYTSAIHQLMLVILPYNPNYLFSTANVKRWKIVKAFIS